jgi:omega-6 fatty acid desaturase (delta-12 desaturase)
VTTAHDDVISGSHASSGQQRFWQDAVVPFRSSSARRGLFQLCTTLPALALLLYVMYRSLAVSYWVTLALSPITAGFLLRTFIIMHDCAHGSFLPWRRANEIIGFFTGVLTFTPFAQWRRDHALHHASSGDLDRRGHGDVHTLTVSEYLARDRWERFKYRAFRNPFILFGFGPIYMMLSQRWRPPSTATKTKQLNSVLYTNVSILILAVAFSLLIGWRSVVLVFGPVFYLAAMAGIWLFYVQHQFEDTYWEAHESWDYATAALRGSSYYRLPRILEWFSGSIGLHHVHHIDPRIPNYHLRSCHEAVDEFRSVPELTLRRSLRSMHLSLWDAERGRLIGFKELSADQRQSRGTDARAHEERSAVWRRAK